jgi:hypothetical protein
MAECEYINECPYPQGKLSGREDEREALMDEYCRSNSLHCARYMVSMALGADQVPADLFPDEKGRGYQLIAGSQ